MIKSLVANSYVFCLVRSVLTSVFPNGTATAARGMLLSELAAGQHSVFPGLVEVYDKIVRPAGGEEAGSAGGMSCR